MYSARCKLNLLYEYVYTASLCVEALGGDSVDLVDEDDRGRVLLGEAEHVAHHPRALAQVLLHELAAHHVDERRRRVVRHRLRQHRLPAPGRTEQQHAARRVDADLPVQLVVRQRQLHRLAHLPIPIQQKNYLKIEKKGLRKHETSVNLLLLSIVAADVRVT